ncbi:MAG: toll/interleukin-1 receptor domain-containing protein [Verrucomicrobiota bacterium]|jgi:uncharacterized protein YjbI with pentapeptide repeats
MANPEHLKILKQGVKVWNRWREENRDERPDLSYAKLSGAILSGAILNGAVLSRADLSYAELDGAHLIAANLIATKLSGANLRAVNLSGAILINAHLSGAYLSRANLFGGNLSRANLSSASLSRANLFGANLTGTILTAAYFGRTTIGNVDLSAAIGLETMKHYAPSTIGIDTLYKSQGKIPDEFLRDAGVPEEIITHLLPSIRCGKEAIQWHSCFISYSSKDEEFAKRLHARMRAANMRVWFAPEDLKGGKKLHEQLYEAIQIQDRLLVVLSEHSIQSEWVMTEIREAREAEKKEKRRKLFPIRLTDFETLRDWTCFDSDTGKDLAVEVREYFIPDFSNWKDHDAFESAFARLKKDLEAENSRR